MISGDPTYNTIGGSKSQRFGGGLGDEFAKIDGNRRIVGSGDAEPYDMYLVCEAKMKACTGGGGGGRHM